MSQHIPYQDAGPARLSKLAVVLFAASILAALTSFLIVPPLLIWLLAAGTSYAFKHRRDLDGLGFLAAARTVSICSLGLGLCILFIAALVTPTRYKTSGRVCGTNLKGIATSMNLYAEDIGSGVFPSVPYAPYISSMSKPSPQLTVPDPLTAMNSLFAANNPQAGSVQACMWLMVLNQNTSSKQFTCPQDNFVKSSSRMTAGDRYNFSPNTLSYSFAYPWTADGKVAPWWKQTQDADIPLAADMAPFQGTGTPARNLIPGHAPADPRTMNSANHEGFGQNVSFSDAHCEFARTPTVGPDHDNIYTTSGTPSFGPAEYTGIPAGRTAPQLRATTQPYDILMLPVRNETTGAM
jgi:hypothetical protein